MPVLNRLTGPFAALLLGFVASGLSAQTATEGEAPAEPEAEAAAGETVEEAAPELVAGVDYDASTVVVMANDIEITLGELIAVRRTLPEQYQQLPGEVLMQALGDQIATQMLLAEAARDSGLADRPDIALTLKAQAMGLLAETFVREQILERLTPEAVEAAYEERYQNAEPEVEVRAAHILVDSPEKAAELKAELDDGAEFAALAAEHGTDGTAQRGGDLGWFIKQDMVPEFADAAFALEEGQVSDPVQTQFGWHLIKKEGTRERAAPPLEAVFDDIQTELAGEIEQEIYARVTEDATIVKSLELVPGEAIKQDELLDPAE